MTLVGRGLGEKDVYTKRYIYKQMETRHCSHKCIKRAVHNQCAWHIMTISPPLNLFVTFIINLGLDSRSLNPSGGTVVLHNVRTNSRAHPASYPMGAGGCFPRGEVTGGIKLTHSLPASAEVKNGGAILPRLHVSSWYSA
jgi:hypothetical protein